MQDNQLLQRDVPDSLFIPIRDHISPGYLLTVPFHVDEGTTRITAAKLYYIVERISENTGKPISFTALKDFIRIYIDGVERTSIDNVQGSLDLTRWITNPGWHKVEIHSTSLIRIDGQLNIRSFVDWPTNS